MLVYGCLSTVSVLQHVKPPLWMSLRVSWHIHAPTSKAQKCLLPCFHVDPEDVLTFPVHLHLYWNYEIQCCWFTGRNSGIRTSIRRCVSRCIQDVCVRRKWPSCLILSKELPHLLLRHSGLLALPFSFLLLWSPLNLCLLAWWSWIITGTNRLTLKICKIRSECSWNCHDWWFDGIWWKRFFD